MKRLLILSVCILSGWSLCHAQANKAAAQSGPRFKFEEETHDFGAIPAGPDAVTEFWFKNAGDAPLLIPLCTTSGSAVCEWPKDPIAPGKKGAIKVHFYTAGKEGQPFRKTIYITSNAIYDKDRYPLEIKGRIAAAPPAPALKQ